LDPFPKTLYPFTSTDNALSWHPTRSSSIPAPSQASPLPRVPNEPGQTLPSSHTLAVPTFASRAPSSLLPATYVMVTSVLATHLNFGIG